MRRTPRDGLQRLSKRWRAARASSPEISRVAQDYMKVPVDWREEQVEMPKGNPWSWSYEQLQDYINAEGRNGETNFGQSK